MKKLSAILLCLLFLTSCTPYVPKQVDSPVDPNVFHLKSLPDIGAFSGMNNDENAPDDFVPSDDYGMILPYIGSYRVFETPKSEGDDWHTEIGYSSYGFCTPDGRVVMKPSNKNTYLNFRSIEDGFGYYTLNREIQPVEDAPDEWIPSETYIIPKDGSWCIKLGEGSWVANVGGGYISVCEYPNESNNLQQVRTVIYDYDGNMFKTFDGVDSSGRFSNGLLLVSEWGDNGYSAHFVNENGEAVLGPYSSAVDFNEYGISCVKDENGAYLMNTKGERLTDYYESFFNEYSDDGKAQVFSGRYKGDNKKCDVYSPKGELLGTVEGATYASFRFPDNGEIYYYYTFYPENEKGYPIYNQEKMIWKNLRTGEDFVSSEFGFSPNSYSGTDNCFINVDKELKKACIFDGNGETIAVINGVSDVSTVSEHAEFVIFVEGEYIYEINPETGEPYEDTRKTHIYDTKKGEIVYTVEAGGNVFFADANKRFITIAVYDQNDFFGGLSKSWLFDTKTGEIVLDECDDISLYDLGDKTYIASVKGNAATLYDENFKQIKKVYND